MRVPGCLLVMCLLIGSAQGAEFVGNSTCQDCHQEEFQQWTVSDHQKSMLPATVESVLGNFSDIRVSFHGIESRFYIDEGIYLVDTLNEDGELERFQIKYTFGHDPLQQYLVELENGHVQALNIAWDSRPTDQGGQRWFHLQPDENINSEHPFYWANHFSNWNSRCAECHSTDLQRNYSPDDGSYATTWSEINVSCEGCHGPASDHVAMAQTGNLIGEFLGFEKSLAKESLFQFSGDEPIARNIAGDSSMQLDTCAVCHSRRGVSGGYEANRFYHEQYQLSFLNRELYFADGQINDEVFVFGSFVQSKMYQAGVSCTDCHNAHTAELKAPANTLCLSCHQAETYRSLDHHQHPLASAGAQCTSCHMPERTYMQVDARADHSFSIPRPALANRIGAPNACNNCHDDWSATEVIANYVQLFGEETESVFAEANQEVQRLNTLALPNILAVANDTSFPAIQRATLLSQAANFPARITLESIQRNLLDSDPLVRRAAVEASAILPPQGRLQLLQNYMNDEVKTVRLAVANQLADAFAFAPEPMHAEILALFDEHEESLLYIQDTPGGQLNLATYYIRRGNPVATIRAYERALEIEPNFVPALLNLADLRREDGNEAEAESLLQRAITIAPDSGAAQHALGLLNVRTGSLSQALEQLRLATQTADASPRYSYVYAVALESEGEIDVAIDVLKQSEENWPNQPESLLLLISFLDREERGIELLPYLSNLSRIMPSDPTVQALVNKYVQR
ncbi:MAG: tetratricopeptide repeat protein [Pseudomonadales bacterium]|nr:tetratricopeptide repeat protein [Pseudomonadales bacterium]